MARTAESLPTLYAVRCMLCQTPSRNPSAVTYATAGLRLGADNIMSWTMVLQTTSN